MKMSPEVNEVFTAFSLFQAEVEDVKRDSNSLKGKYAKIEQVLQATRKILTKHGLAISQLIGNCSGEYVEVYNIILHKSGQFFSQKMALATGGVPLNSQGKESINRAQFVGLNISYARRYGLLAILGMAQEDEDAEVHQQKPYQRPTQQYLPKPSAPKYIANVSMAPKQEIPHAKEIDVKKLAVEQIENLIKHHGIPVEKIDKIKEHYSVKSLSELDETQAKSVVNKIKSSFDVNAVKAGE